MTKVCLTCKSKKNFKDITIKTKKANWKEQMGIKGIFPNDKIVDIIKEQRPKRYDIKEVLTLSPKDSGKYILYYASNLKPDCSRIPSAKESYNNFTNMGISKINSSGKTTIYLTCPNIYKEEGKTFYSHFHFIVSKKNNKEWINKLYTKIITCNIKKDSVSKYLKEGCTMIINALPIQYFIKNRIDNSISLPTDSLSSLKDKEIIKYIEHMTAYYPKLLNNLKQKKITLMEIPIITYCYNKTCDASTKLNDRLLNIGFVNIKKYEDGILDWIKH